jgi:hypothetical protein
MVKRNETEMLSSPEALAKVLKIPYPPHKSLTLLNVFLRVSVAPWQMLFRDNRLLK